MLVQQSSVGVMPFSVWHVKTTSRCLLTYRRLTTMLVRAVTHPATNTSRWASLLMTDTMTRNGRRWLHHRAEMVNYWCHVCCVTACIWMCPCLSAEASAKVLFTPLPGISLEVRGEIIRTVLCCIVYWMLCTVISTLRWAVITVLWIGFCLTGPISLCIDSCVYVFFCVVLSYCICVVLL